jgi:predicted RNA-binding protein with PIN domain
MTVYLIDGYNVLHQLIGHKPLADGKGAPGTGGASAGGKQAASRGGGGSDATGLGSRGTQPDLEDARKHLVDQVASYMGRTTDRAILVFDSHTQLLQKQESATANVEVYFGSFSHSADSIIEREVFALSTGETVVVVSSDYQLQKTIFRANVIRRSSRQFVSDLQEETKRIAISQNCTTMSHRIEDRVDAQTVAKLKALRDSLTGKPEEQS